jgi:hypothetical protein
VNPICGCSRYALFVYSAETKPIAAGLSKASLIFCELP